MDAKRKAKTVGQTGKSTVRAPGILKSTAALHKNNHHLMDMMLTMQLVALILDTKGEVTFCNDHLLEVTGWQRREVMGKKWFGHFVPSRPINYTKLFKAAIKDGHFPVNCKTSVLTKSGAPRLINWNNTLLHNAAGDVTGLASIGEDITSQSLAEEALRKSDERLQAFFNQSLDGFFFCHFEQPREWKKARNKAAVLEDIINTQRFTDVNDAMLKQYNISREDFLKLTTRDVFAHDLEQGRKLRRELFDNGHLHLETYERMSDGTPVWFEGDYVCLYDNNGRVTGFFGIQRDITDRKEAEIALREAEEKYRGIFENAAEGIYQTTPDGRIITANPALARMLGYESPRALIESITDVGQQAYVEPALRAKFIAQIEKQGSVTGIEYQIRRKDNTSIWVSENARLVRNANGEMLYEGIIEDITERKHAAEQLLVQSAALNAAANAIVITDRHGNIEWVNPAYSSLTGYAFAELVGKNQNILNSGLQDKEFYKTMWDTILSGKVWRGSVVNKRKDGTLYTADNAITPILDANGQVVRFIGISQDVTDRKQNEQRLDRQLKRLNALRAIDNAIKSSTDLGMTLEVLLKETLIQLKADAACVFLFNKHTLTLDYAASRGFHSKMVQHIKLGSHQSYAAQVALERKTVHISDIKKGGGTTSLTLLPTGENFNAYVGTPLVSKGQTMGVLEIYQRAPLDPDVEWFDFLEMLAGQTAIAIDSAQMFENLQRSNFELTLAYDATIEGWSRALDLRDREAEGHTQRVTSLTVQLARRLGIPDPDLLHIRRGSLLHDIGNMGVPDGILQKNGALTPEEMQVMRQHPLYATEILNPIAYLRPALDIPRYHHEKWDGSGYPHGLKGAAIPLAARIFAVVDVYDALTSERPYRATWPKDQVLEYLQSESGKHFDPAAVAAFLELIENH